MLTLLTENLFPIRKHHFQVHFSQIDSPLQGSSDCFVGERSSHMESSESMVVWHSYHSRETYKIQNCTRIDRWLGDLSAHCNFSTYDIRFFVTSTRAMPSHFRLDFLIGRKPPGRLSFRLIVSLHFLKTGTIATLTQPFKQGKPRCRTPPQVQSNAASSELTIRSLAASCCFFFTIMYPLDPICATDSQDFSSIPALDHQCQ